MNLNDFGNNPQIYAQAPSVSSPQNEEEAKSLLDGYLSQSVIGHDYIWNSKEKMAYEKEDYTLDDANTLLNQYQFDDATNNEILQEGQSIQHIYDIAEDKKRNNGQLAMIEGHGALGMAGMLGTSILDLPSWVIGGTLGKIAGIGIKAGRMGNVGSKLMKAGAGAGTAVSSVALLEASLGNELTDEQIAINGALGFTLGYVLSGSKAYTPEGTKRAQELVDGTKPIKMKHPKENYLMDFMHSASDRMKASDNPTVSELGYKFTRSMGDVGQQMDDTINDVLRRTKTHLTNGLDEFQKYADEFEKAQGRPLTIDDEKIINRIGLSMDNQYNQMKIKNIAQQKQVQINQHLRIARQEVEDVVLDLRKQASKLEDDVGTQIFEPEYPKKPIYKWNKKTKQYYETKASLRKTEQIKARNIKKEAKFNKAKETQIQKIRKSLNREVEKNQKVLNKKVKQIQKADFDDATLEVFEKNARKSGMKRLEDMFESVEPKYKPIFDIVRKFKQGYADDIVKNNVDGLENMDTAFHWSRQYDADRISMDTDGAIDAFERGLRANFDEIGDELGEALQKEARSIVNKILSSKSSYETIDLDLSAIQRLVNDSKIKTNVIGKNLKGRTLNIDGSELIEFMNNDIVSNMTGYSRSVGGRIAVKEVLGIDSLNTANQFALKNGLMGKDRKFFDTALQQALGTHGIDPHSNSLLSKLSRGFTGLNYINFGGWFGVNTLSDLSGVVNDFEFGRTMKYATHDLVDSLKKHPQGQVKGKTLARYIGYASEGFTNDRALLYGAESYAPSRLYMGEKVIQKGGALVSKYSGMNMVVDFMDRVSSMAGLDYILTANRGTKFVKTMNRLGLTADDVTAMRKMKGLVDFDDIGAIKNVNFDKMGTPLKAKLERGLRRAVADTVLKGNDLDAPSWLTEIAGSHAIARALFQFMRFPTISYNKLGRKMAHNFNVADATVATATGAMILGLTTQMKDVGRGESRFDLGTNEGRIETAKFVIDRMPHIAFVGLVQTQVDVIGRILAKASNEDYKKYPTGMSLGVTMDRLFDIHEAGQRILDGKGSYRDTMLIKSFASTNLFWLQPFNNMLNDAIKENK